MTLPRLASVVMLALAGLAATARSASPGGRVLEQTMLPGPGDRFAGVDFTCWLPEPGRPVRALIIHQHGCGNSSATTNPPVARDAHWQALARAHDCAILVPHYTVEGDCANWNDPESGSERALLAALRGFAARAAQPELVTAPWILCGHSGGSSWSAQMMVRHPGRIIAASFRGGCHHQFGDPMFRRKFVQAAANVPLLFVWGRGESVPASSHYVSWEPMHTMFRELRTAGAKVARAIDPRTEHDCGDSRLLVIPFFDAVLAAGATGLDGSWLPEDATTTAPATPGAQRDPTCAWLPTAAVAARWRMFQATGTVRPEGAPDRQPTLRATPAVDKPMVTLDWQIEPALDGGLRTVRIYRDGTLWKEIGRANAKFLATNRDSPPYGLHETTTRDTSVEPGDTHGYAVSFTDVVGVESPRSEPATVVVGGRR